MNMFGINKIPRHKGEGRNTFRVERTVSRRTKMISLWFDVLKLIYAEI